MVEQSKELISQKRGLETLLDLTMSMIKQERLEELKRVNNNTETTYGVLHKECIV